jgi:protein arginine kinase activator
MQCDVCKKNKATVHLTQIGEGGKVHKVDLCETCAREKGVQDPTGFSLADLLVGLGAGTESKLESPGVRCPACGFSQADFKKTGRLGCAECWNTFEPQIEPLLKAMHKGERHVGKVPTKAAHTQILSEKIKLLTDELQKAVSEEKYEDAAEIRDKIRDIETKLKSGTPVT